MICYSVRISKYREATPIFVPFSTEARAALICSLVQVPTYLCLPLSLQRGVNIVPLGSSCSCSSTTAPLLYHSRSCTPTPSDAEAGRTIGVVAPCNALTAIALANLSNIGVVVVSNDWWSGHGATTSTDCWSASWLLYPASNVSWDIS